MEIRRALSKDKQEILELWKYCFKDKQEFVNWYFSNKYTEDNTLVAYDGEVLSAMQMIDYRLEIRGSRQAAGYVVGVSTSPSARGMGLVPKLMKSSFEVMRSRGHNITILMPFMFSFYTRYGYELCYHRLRHSMEIEKLKDIALRGGKFLRVDKSRLDLVMEAYDSFTASRHGYVIRGALEWENILGDLETDGGYIYLHMDSHDVPGGYIIYYFEDNTMIVKEMGYRDVYSQRFLYGFIYSHASHMKYLDISLAEDDLTHLLLPDLNQDVKLQPFMMARILDVERLLKSIDYSPEIEAAITIKVSDSVCPWNETPFKLTIHRGTAEYCPISQDDDVDIECSIGAFTQIVMGGIDIKDADRLGLIRYKDSNFLEALDEIFPRQNNFINEYI